MPYQEGQYHETANAHHEAAHAVAAQFFGVPGPIKEVTIEPDEPGLDGQVTFEDASAKPGPEDVAFWIIQSLVGHQAEERWIELEDGFVRNYIEGARNDYRRASRHAIENGLASQRNFDPDVTRADFWEPYERKAREFVEEHWQAIERVAKELLQHGTIPGTRVRALVDGGP